MTVRAPVTVLVVLFFTLGVNIAMAGLFGKPPLGSPWKELFANVSKLNEYLKQGRLAEIHDVLIVNYDLSGARFENVKFDRTEWRNVVAKNAVFKNTVFRHCKMEGLELEQSTFENVTFEDCELTNVSFFESKLPGVRFINSKLKDETTFQASRNGDLIFDQVTMSKAAFFEAQGRVLIKNSKLNDVNMTGLAAPSSLTIEKSELMEVDFSDSELTSFTFRESQAKKSGFQGGHVGTLRISDSTYGMSFREMTIGQYEISKSSIVSRHVRTKIETIRVSDCKAVTDFAFYEANVKTFEINRCMMTNFDVANATIESLALQHSAIKNSDFSDLQAGHLLVEDVDLSEKIDFTNAKVGTLIVKGVKKSPNLQLITTGSNVKFD